MSSGRATAATIALALLAQACGGGGGGGPPPANRLPIVDPGPPQTVLEQRTVTLTGTASDPDGTVTAIAWTQDHGPAVTLAGANTLTATFVSPPVSVPVIFLFRLTATDNQNAQTFMLVNVFVNPDPLLNAPPTADAGADRRIGPGVSGTFSGAASSDSDGTLAGYQWVQIGGPAVVQLNNETTATPSFIAPRPATDAVLTFQLRVTDNEGATATDTIDVTVVANNALPVVNAGTDQTVLEQRTITLAGSANDPDGTVVAYQWTNGDFPPVTIQNASSPTATFQSPAVSFTRFLNFTLLATDDLGSQNSDSVLIRVDPDPALNVPPVAQAGPDRSAATQVRVPLSGLGSFDPDGDPPGPPRFAWTQIGGIAVTLSSPNFQDTNFTAPASPDVLTFLLTVTDNEGATGTDTVVVTVTDPGPVTGRISYDKVPFSAGGAGLDYGNIIAAPVRGAVVEAISSANGFTILATTSTDANGNYTFNPAAGETFLIRVKAQMLRAGMPSWNFRVVNNTNGDALYAMQGAPFLYLGATTTVDLRANSGWTGTSYTQERVAAPFSLLDVAYDVSSLVLSANPTAQFLPLDIHWSQSNAPSDFFFPANGDIVTTHYSPGNVYVLGLQGLDTDEYDQHVIAHELAHYFQDAFSRDDSIGGPHGPGDRLDLRVAFSEGWGNAFSGMVKGDPRYRDSFGTLQAADFDIDVESDPVTNPGWFSEGSVQSILYDVFDATADANDSVTLGFLPLFEVLNTDLPATEPFTSIFPFTRALKTRNAGAAAGIDALLNGQSIVGTTIDELGSTETNNGGSLANLPVYRAATINGGTQQVCSSTVNGEYNALGNRRILRFNVPGTQQVTFRAAAAVGTDPDMALHRMGLIAQSIADSTGTGIEQFSRTLSPGNYVLEVYDFFATDFSTVPSGNTCLDVTISSP